MQLWSWSRSFKLPLQVLPTSKVASFFLTLQELSHSTGATEAYFVPGTRWGYWGCRSQQADGSDIWLMTLAFNHDGVTGAKLVLVLQTTRNWVKVHEPTGFRHWPVVSAAEWCLKERKQWPQGLPSTPPGNLYGVVLQEGVLGGAPCSCWGREARAGLKEAEPLEFAKSRRRGSYAEKEL